MGKAAIVTERMREIATQIYGAASPVGLAVGDVSDAQDALNGFREAAVNQRELTLGTIAQMSSAGNWTEAEIAAATKLAAKMGNALKDKSLATFISETRRAAHPNARNAFVALMVARDEAWDAEDAARKLDKDVPCPLRALFSRRYHTLIRQLGEAADGVTLTTPQSLVNYAQEHDPALDAAKVLVKIEGLMGSISEISGVFPDTSLKMALDNLAKVTEGTLIHSRAPAVSNTVADTTTVVNPQDGQNNADDDEPEGDATEVLQGTPASGVMDVWGDLMADAA